MASERIRQYTMPDGTPNTGWHAASDGDHVTLPLDANALDDYALDEAAQAYIDERAAQTGQPTGPANIWAKAAMRAAIAAYANHVAEVSRGNT